MKVVIDKSFIQAKSEAALEALQFNFDFVITENLLYETCKADPSERKSISKKMLSLPKRVYYTSVKSILAHELKSLSPFDPENLLPRRKEVSLLQEMSTSAIVTKKIRTAIEVTERHYENLYEKYIPHLALWRDKEIGEIISDINNSSQANFPINKISSSWGAYNLVACLKYYAADIFGRYEQRVLAGRPPYRVIHDLLDIDYAVLAMVCGGIATRDEGIIKCLEKVCGESRPKLIS